MGDASIIKVQSAYSPKGEMGQIYLASGKSIAMRLWKAEQPGEEKIAVARDYETVGYVVAGRAELHAEGQKIHLEPGDSWVVPRGAMHTYRIEEPFTAIEATYPTSQVHGRDDAPTVEGKTDA